ncbi:MAG: TlpA family protein disulfide reductase [Planctomycetota bacterium]
MTVTKQTIAAVAKLTMVAILSSLTPGAVAGASEHAAKEKAKPEATEKPADTEAAPAGEAAADPFQVPEGDPEQLLEFIDTVARLRPAAMDPESIEKHRRKVYETVIKATDKILEAKPSDEQLADAIRVRAVSLGWLGQNGDAKADEQLLAMPANLRQQGREALARRVQSFIYRMQMQRLLGGDDPLVAEKKLRALVDEIQEYIGPTPTADELELAVSTAQMVEAVIGPEEAGKLYLKFGEAFQKSDQPELAEIGKKLVGSGTRLSLVGQPMPLEGLHLDGSKFSWDNYKDKTVLVQFWATWCMPCRQEIENIREVYNKYHEKGFDVIGINLDDDVTSVREFLAQNPLPWNQLVSADENARGMDSPMAVRYGVMAIPEVVLVGKDGKVAALEARGPQLWEEVQKLLGPVEGAKEEKGGGHEKKSSH